MRAEAGVAALAFLASAATAADLAPLSFEPPAAGSYELPVVDRVRDHPVVDSSGRATTLFSLKEGRLAVVAFIYTSCPEEQGCPLGQAILHRLDREIVEDDRLHDRVSLVSLSFDPARDTPERLENLRELTRPRGDWRFATTRPGEDLVELLDDFNQSVVPLHDDEGRFTGRFRHVLKLFLLDRANRVRNVYSSGFLAPEVVLNDLRTLLADAETPWPTPADGSS